MLHTTKTALPRRTLLRSVIHRPGRRVSLPNLLKFFELRPPMTSFRLLFLFVALLQQSEGFRFRSVCSYSRVNLNTLLSVTVNEGDPNEADVAQSSDDNESKIVDLAGNLVKALQEGREEDLKEAGLKIGKKSSRLVMDENLSSGEAIEKILGPVDEEQLEIMSSLSNIQAQGDDYDIQVDKDINPDRIAEQSLLDDIQAEGLAVASQIQSQGSGIGSLLKDRDNESSEFDVTLDVLSSSSKPSQAVKEVTPGKIENTDLSSTALDSIAVEAGLSEAAKQDAQTTFTNLLKVTMDAAQETGANNFSEEDMRKAVAAVSTGNMETLDVKSVIGESLSMLTDQLGIDMNAEVKEGAMKNDMQAIISISMAELASNMAELDAQSEGGPSLSPSPSPSPSFFVVSICRNCTNI